MSKAETVRLQDAPHPTEFTFLTIPIDSGLIDCGKSAREWQPSDIVTVNDLLRLLSRSRGGLQDCWHKQDLIAHPPPVLGSAAMPP